MQARLRVWDDNGDGKSVFLSCYHLMTGNMVKAITQGEFADQAWVDGLLRRFAGYYFVALDQYENNPQLAPLVWQRAHRAAAEKAFSPLQRLLHGVNAHINFDLVFALNDLLEPEWRGLDTSQQAARYADHCHVNAVIGKTIDAVQRDVLGPAMPGLALLDSLLGQFDEQLIVRTITQWRETVWSNAMRLLDAGDTPARAQLICDIEADALKISDLIG